MTGWFFVFSFECPRFGIIEVVRIKA